MQSHSHDGRVRVGVRVNMNLDYIDDVNEEIHVDLELAMHWEDEAARNWKDETIRSMGGKQPLPFMPIPDSVPGLRPTFELMYIRSQEVTMEILLVSSKTGTVYLLRFLRVSIKDILDLRLFPFDRQIVKLQFFSYLSFLEPWFAPIDDAPIRILLHKGWKENQFVVNSDQEDWFIAFVDAKLVVDGRRRLFSVRFGVERNSMYYLANFFVTMFVVVQFGSFVVSIDCTDFGTRSSVTITLLLTLVAFKFVMGSYIPKIPYQTLLDKYTIFGTMMLGVTIIENFFVSSLFNPDASPTIEYRDQVFAIVWNAVWWVVHSYLVIGERFNWFRVPWEMVKLEDERKEKNDIARQSKGFSLKDYHEAVLGKTEIDDYTASDKKNEDFSGGPPPDAAKRLTANAKRKESEHHHDHKKDESKAKVADSDDDD